MSEFEYLRHISIGQYLPLASFIHRIDPRAKLLAYAVLIIALSLSGSLFGLLLGLALTFALLVSSHTPLSYALRGWLTALPFLLILAVLQVFLIRLQTQSVALFTIFGIRIHAEGLQAALRLLLRFTALYGLLTVATATLTTLETIHALEMLLKPLRVLGINPAPLAMMVQIMLRFIPFLALSAEKIAKSQASRGAQWDGRKGGLVARARRVLPLIIPLFIISLRQAETLTDAMLARGFDSRLTRTSMHAYVFGLTDVVFLLLTLVSALMMLFFPL